MEVLSFKDMGIYQAGEAQQKMLSCCIMGNVGSHKCFSCFTHTTDWKSRYLCPHCIHFLNLSLVNPTTLWKCYTKLLPQHKRELTKETAMAAHVDAAAGSSLICHNFSFLNPWQKYTHRHWKRGCGVLGWRAAALKMTNNFIFWPRSQIRWTRRSRPNPPRRREESGANSPAWT